MDKTQMSSRGGRAKRRRFRFGTMDIAGIKGKSEGAVRKDWQRGVFNPKDLRSLVRYLRWEVD